MTVVAHQKVTHIGRRMAVMRDLLDQITADMETDPDAVRAFRDATELEKLGSQISQEAAEIRAWSAARLHYEKGMQHQDIASKLGLSFGRVGQLVRAGRKKNELVVARNTGS